MCRILRYACLALLLFSATLAPAAESPVEPGPLVTSGENDAEWRPFFAALAAKAPVFSIFVEYRMFSFRKQPTELRGEMRLDPAHGLSLRYTYPEERIMIVDEKGVLLRDDRGRSRAVPDDPRAPAANAALLPILRFDFDQLLQRFELRAARGDGGTWRLDFTPRDERLERSMGHITVLGAGEAVTQLQFRRSASQQVEIFIGETRTGQQFKPDEVARFFR